VTTEEHGKRWLRLAGPERVLSDAPRAASVTEAVLGAAIEGFEGGDATNPSHRSIEPYRVLGSSRRAPRAVEKAQALPSCKASSFLGTHGAAWREAHLSERGE